MKYIRVRLSALVVLLVNVIAVYAQTASKDFVQINQAYAKTKGLRMDVSYTLFKSWTSGEVLQKQSGEMKWKSANQMYTRVGESETFRNADYLMTVNHETKRILLMAVLNTDPTPGTNVSFGSIDTLLKLCKKVEYATEPNGHASYTLTMGAAHEYGRVKLTFHTKTYFITQIIFFYNRPVQVAEGAETVEYTTRLQIDYTNISANAGLSGTDFGFEKYLLMANNKPELKKMYQTYTLLDQYTSFRKNGVQKN